VVRPALEKIPGVASVEVRGAAEREAHIDVDRKKLERYRLTLAQVAQKVGAETMDVPAGRLTLGAREEGIKTEARPRSAEELAETVLTALPDGGVLRLRDVAEVSLGLEELRTLSRINGDPAVTFDIQRAGGANTAEGSKQVHE